MDEEGCLLQLLDVAGWGVDNVEPMRVNSYEILVAGWGVDNVEPMRVNSYEILVADPNKLISNPDPDPEESCCTLLKPAKKQIRKTLILSFFVICMFMVFTLGAGFNLLLLVIQKYLCTKISLYKNISVQKYLCTKISLYKNKTKEREKCSQMNFFSQATNVTFLWCYFI